MMENDPTLDRTHTEEMKQYIVKKDNKFNYVKYNKLILESVHGVKQEITVKPSDLNFYER
tara:strand:+ start:333 stop:512 length:180 start_codon:yes stop_codon:yes gene_type:complete